MYTFSSEYEQKTPCFLEFSHVSDCIAIQKQIEIKSWDMSWIRIMELPATMSLQKQQEGGYGNLRCILHIYFPQPGSENKGGNGVHNYSKHLDEYLLQFLKNSENALSESWVHLISTLFNWWQWIEALMSSWSPVNGPKLHVSIVISCKKREKKRGKQTHLAGLEPATFRLTAERANRLRHKCGCYSSLSF